MRPRRRRHRDQKDEAHGIVGGPVIAILPLILLGLLSSAHMLRREAQRPNVGDMIIFQPNMTARDTLRLSIPAARVDPGADASSHCWLDSWVMMTGGGSLLVERRLPTDPPWFRLHWAGARTDGPGRDCGASATIDVSRPDLRKLATAAKGFAPPAR